MKKSLTILLVIILIIPLPFSCDWGQTGKYGPSSFKIEKPKLEVGSISSSTYDHRLEPVPPTDSIISNEFGIKISIDSVSYISMIERVNRELFINLAFADPVPPSSKSHVTLISIYSSQNLLADEVEYVGGTNLVPLFQASNDYSQPQSVLTFVEEFKEWYEWDYILLHFNSPLGEPIRTAFTVKVTMSDGVVFELESDEVIIK